jgi:REP-associated tyrosine transposase
MSRLRRPILAARLFFITTNLRQGIRPFTESEFQILIDALIRVRKRLPVKVCAYCFMPDHLHAILFINEETTISDALMRFKIATSRRITPLRGHPIWQSRFYDRALRTRGEYDATRSYIHMNPVRRGLVADPIDWPWSSARWFEQRTGPMEIDSVRLPFDADARI